MKQYAISFVIFALAMMLAGGIGLFLTRPKHMPRIEISCEQEFSSTQKEKAQFTYYDLEKSMDTEALIKYRGGFSISQPKKSYTLNLATDVSPARLPPDDDWMLISCYIDKTLMRHKVCYDLFSSLSNKNLAAQSCFVELIVNDNYVGIYMMAERLDEKRLNLDKNDSGATCFKDPPIFYHQYLAYYDSRKNYYEQKFPQWPEQNRSYLMDSLRQFLFESPDFVFTDSSKGIQNWFDLENVIDWHLMLLVTNNSDGLLKNFYLFRKTRYAPFRFAIWDYDHSFGRDGDNEPNMLKRRLDINRNELLKRLMQTNHLNYRQKLHDRWLELRAHQFSEARLFKMIDENAKKLSPLVEKNFVRWPYDGPYYYDKNTFEQEVEVMKQYLRKCLPMMDSYFENLSLAKPNDF